MADGSVADGSLYSRNDNPSLGKFWQLERHSHTQAIGLGEAGACVCLVFVYTAAGMLPGDINALSVCS